MSMLTSAFAMLGSYYSEANPSLQGECTSLLTSNLRVNQPRLHTHEPATIHTNHASCVHQVNVYTPQETKPLSPPWTDKYTELSVKRQHWLRRYHLTIHIINLEMSDIDIDRMAYRVRQGRDFVTPPVGLSYTGS